MPKRTDAYTVHAPKELLAQEMPKGVSVTVDRQVQGTDLSTKFVFDGQTVKDILLAATRDHVIKRGNKERELSPEALAELAGKTAVVHVKDSSKKVVTKAERLSELRALKASMSEAEWEEFKAL